MSGPPPDRIVAVDARPSRWWNRAVRRAALLIAVAAALGIAALATAAAGARHPPVVLGGTIYGGPNGHGWGVPHPKFIYNGGGASGSISDVHWSDWRAPVAHGRGRHPTFRPRGGYYRRPVVAQLKAIDLGRCEGHAAYLRLLIREPRRPGGQLGPWRSWAGPQTICEPYGSSSG
jgi:hypothetical protein